MEKEIRDYTEEERNRMHEFLEVTFSMTDEENAAFYRQIPMTQEMYEHLEKKFTELGAEVHFEELLREFPDQMNIAAEKELSEIDMDSISHLTEEQDLKIRKALTQRIMERFGEDPGLLNN